MFPYNNHLLSECYGHFDEDFDIAIAWKRLENGTYTAEDLVFLKHEYVEASFEGRYNLSYKEAHRIAQSFYLWSEKASKKGGRIGSFNVF